MHTAQNDRHTALPKFRGDLISPPRGIGFDGDDNKIGGFIVRNRLHPVIVQNDVDIGRRQTAEHAQHQGLHATFVDIQAVLSAANRRFDQDQSHRLS